eukprot:12383090-Heterocapsa_arctica.AAC.1
MELSRQTPSMTSLTKALVAGSPSACSTHRPRPSRRSCSKTHGTAVASARPFPTTHLEATTLPGLAFSTRM